MYSIVIINLFFYSTDYSIVVCGVTGIVVYWTGLVQSRTVYRARQTRRSAKPMRWYGHGVMVTVQRDQQAIFASLLKMEAVKVESTVVKVESVAGKWKKKSGPEA